MQACMYVAIVCGLLKTSRPTKQSVMTPLVIKELHQLATFPQGDATYKLYSAFQ